MKKDSEFVHPADQLVEEINDLIEKYSKSLGYMRTSHLLMSMGIELLLHHGPLLTSLGLIQSNIIDTVQIFTKNKGEKQ